MNQNDSSLPNRINDFISKQQVQKGPKSAIAGGIIGGIATGHPLGVLGGAYIGHRLGGSIGWGKNRKGMKGIRRSKPPQTKYTPGSAKRIKR